MLSSRRLCTRGLFSVASLHSQKLYRPVGVYVVANASRELILTKPVGLNFWSFPQGGIKKNETLEENMLRELQEELGVRETDLFDLELDLFRGYVDFEPDRTNRRGFSKGKAYVFSYAKVRDMENLELTLQQEEVEEAGWVPAEKCMKLFEETGKAKKTELLQDVMKIILGKL